MELEEAHRRLLAQLEVEAPGTAQHDLLTLAESYLAEYLLLVKEDVDASASGGADDAAQ